MRKLFCMSAMILVAGCATVSTMTPTGGSRSDGIVEMSFEYGAFDKVNIDQQSSLVQARARCQTWGYQDAEPFGGVVRQCQAAGGYGCMRWFATVKYQCTGGKAVN